MTITTPEGFVANGIASGIKASGALDLAILASATGVAVPTAAVFTTNLAAAPPVTVSRRHLAATGGRQVAVVVSSGNANAATGEQGRRDAEAMCALSAEGIGCRPEEVLVCSTGLIGYPLPMDVIVGGIPKLVAGRGAGVEHATAAATGILTTDGGRKEALVAGPGFAVAGMAKGAGMLAPNMATMLAFLTTDAAVGPGPLAELLALAVGGSFNAMSVDGCTSTNDTVVLMASGQAGPADPGALAAVVTEVCVDLAGQMAADAEGASKVAHVRVTGAASDADASRAARKVAESLLVKCSFNGEDPYWGRVVSELGSSGSAFAMDRVQVAYGGVTVCRAGVAVAHDAGTVRSHLAGRSIDLHCDLGIGDGSGAIMTVDLGHGYIDENRGTS